MKLRLAAIAVAGAVALVVALRLGPHERVLAATAYVDLLAALLMIGLVATLRAALPSAPQRRRRRRRRPEQLPRPQQLERLDRQLGDPYAFRKLVVQIASAALARKHGVVLEREPERARAIVGERVWELVESPMELRRDELGRVLADLEAIA